MPPWLWNPHRYTIYILALWALSNYHRHRQYRGWCSDTGIGAQTNDAVAELNLSLGLSLRSGVVIILSQSCLQDYGRQNGLGVLVTRTDSAECQIFAHNETKRSGKSVIDVE